MGFLQNRFEDPISFDSLYTVPWLASVLNTLGMRSKGLSTYKVSIDRIEAWDPDFEDRSASEYSVRAMDKSKFHDEIRLFGNLANECLADTPLYFPRDPEALVELLDPLRVLLRSEHLLFALHRDRPVGFLFWHPDFNEVVPGGRAASILEIALRTWCFGSRIRNLKLNALGLSPEHRQGGALRLLLREVHRKATGRFDTIETNFVWDENLASSRLNLRHFGAAHRQYKIYFMDVRK